MSHIPEFLAIIRVRLQSIRARLKAVQAKNEQELVQKQDERTQPEAGWLQVCEGVIEPLADQDALFLRMAQGSIFQNTTMPSGAVTPAQPMMAERGTLVEVKA